EVALALYEDRLVCRIGRVWHEVRWICVPQLVSGSFLRGEEDVRFFVHEMALGAIDDDDRALRREAVHRIAAHLEGEKVAASEIGEWEQRYVLHRNLRAGVGEFAGTEPREQRHLGDRNRRSDGFLITLFRRSIEEDGLCSDSHTGGTKAPSIAFG